MNKKISGKVFMLVSMSLLMLFCTITTAVTGIACLQVGKIPIGVFNLVWSLVCWFIARYDWAVAKKQMNLGHDDEEDSDGKL
jgi:hypothetical protein